MPAFIRVTPVPISHVHIEAVSGISTRTAGKPLRPNGVVRLALRTRAKLYKGIACGIAMHSSEIVVYSPQDSRETS